MLRQYNTDPTNFICACTAYRDSRFLICKHIVFAYNLTSPLKAFNSLQRSTSKPFWKNLTGLQLKDEFIIEESDTDDTNDSEQDHVCPSSSDNAYTVVNDFDHDHEDDIPTPDEIFAAVEETLCVGMNYVKHQRNFGNVNMAMILQRKLASFNNFIEDSDAASRKRRMPQTWKRKNPETMYIQGSWKRSKTSQTI